MLLPPVLRAWEEEGDDPSRSLAVLAEDWAGLVPEGTPGKRGGRGGKGAGGGGVSRAFLLVKKIFQVCRCWLRESITTRHIFSSRGFQQMEGQGEKGTLKGLVGSHPSCLEVLESLRVGGTLGAVHSCGVPIPQFNNHGRGVGERPVHFHCWEEGK